MSDQKENIETRTQQAIAAYNQSDKPNLAKLAREFAIPRSRLRSRVAGHQPHTTLQEKALISWIQTLRHLYTLNTPELIERSCKPAFRRCWFRSAAPPPDVPFISLKPAEKARFESENYGQLKLWFNELKKLIDQYEFLPNEIFNWNETGYQIGQGKRQKAIAPTGAYANPTGGKNESITGIECIAADGWVMLPWFLPKGSNQMEEWYENITIPDFRIKPTENGWINDETAFEWLCSFHEASKTRVQKGRPRLLLMDNHGSHTTIVFISFCKEKFIIPFFFLPHTTHLCQPPDGEAFQCLKHYFRTANNELNTKVIKDLEYQNQQVKRHIQRSMDANSYLSQQLDLVKASLKKSQFHKQAKDQPRNSKSILGAQKSVLSPICANRKIEKRQEDDSKKRQRQQAKHAKELEVEAQAQKARDLAEAEHEARMVARYGSGPNWYMDSRGSYM
ncbi:hypothetical protein N7489_004907 [Penicillium chrysogenum]|uniref:uncharacterized protein n=1 Tax=Penicillium chrysogenum TaxID=5076 RepID=UPI0024DF2D45|nr:uncharacterized protein N7489_004907 [Penicillium chrysogenum]KAJ5244811.1 hypothetical protein N7489_004907 [Penicillium chrysogenum]